MVCEDGKKSDLWFANRSEAARVVNSTALIGTTSTVLEVGKNSIVEEYLKARKL